MNTSELIEKFLEYTNYANNKNVVLIIAYGSRVTSTFREDSDLDILIIISKNGTYRQGVVIEGIAVDITIMSVDDAEQEIIYSKAKGSTYFDAVLKNGLVILDKINLYENLRELLNYKLNRKRTIDGKLLELAEDHIFKFLDGEDDKNIHYFSALELMRKLYHAKCNCSNIQSSKVYDLYTNKKLAKEIYMLKLPDEKFIINYLMALHEIDVEKQKEWLGSFFKELEDITTFTYIDSFFDVSQIQLKLINLNNAIKKCKNMLLNGHPNSKSLFYIIIGEIYYLYELIYGTELQVDIDISCTDVERMIQSLDDFFNCLDADYNIDYNNYRVRLY